MRIKLFDRDGRANVPLHFEDGDVIIKTSDDPSDVFLVHRHILAQRSPYFRSLCSGDWGKPDVSQDGKHLWRLEMYFDFDTGLGLLKEELSREYIRYSDVAPNSTKYWHEYTTDGDLHLFGLQYHGRAQSGVIEIETPTLRQFAYNEPQPTRTLFDGSYYDHENGVTGSVEYFGVSTYAHFLYPHQHLFPDVFVDGEINDDYDPSMRDLLRHRWSIDFRRVVAHEQARKYWSNVWRAYLAFIYGQDVTFLRPHRKQREIRFVADVYRLARYHQTLDTTSLQIQKTLTNLGGIWQACAIKPKWMACLAYEIGCHDIYYEAIRHVAGQLLVNTSLFAAITGNSRYPKNVTKTLDVHYLVLSLQLPTPVAEGVYKCCIQMCDSLLERHSMLLHLLSPLHMSSEFSDLQCYQLATSALLAFFNAWFPIAPNKRWNRTRGGIEYQLCNGRGGPHGGISFPVSELTFQDSRTQLPFLYTRLYRIARQGSIKKIIRVFDLKALGAVYDISSDRLATTILHVLRNTKISEILNGYMRPSDEKGHECHPLPFVDRQMSITACGRFIWPCDYDDKIHYTRSLSTSYSTYSGCYVTTSGIVDVFDPKEQGRKHWLQLEGATIDLVKTNPASENGLRLRGILSESPLLPVTAFTAEAVQKRCDRRVRTRRVYQADALTDQLDGINIVS